MNDVYWPKDLKRTKHRESILNVFIDEDGPLSIVDIQKILHARDNQMWLSTIYRVLDSFVSAHMVNKINLLNDDVVYYELNTAQHVHYAICVNCRSVIELDECPLDLFEKQLQKNNFKIQGHRMEIFGLCEACQ